ncbi:MAG: tRNA uridine(34) 5-carboxymethylaminomethyl modification radical SAM/GNAT enzyme Elp3 [Candidatus Buchananbacteria bacterium]
MTDSIQTILSKIISRNPATEKEFFNIARREFGKFKISSPEKSKLLSAYHRLVKAGKIKSNTKIERFLVKRAIRTLSGVAVISALTKTFPCPGNCLYCPSEKNMPKSYLSNEPAVMRAILAKFDPYKQIQIRLNALRANGHSTEKVELIVMGGTWSYLPKKYQNWFIKRCLDALNGRTATDLAKAQKLNERTKHRCIGLTLETRPDYITKKEVARMRELGCTRVELGIQHIDDAILKLNRRGHDNHQSIKAINLLKEAGFKINYHIMLNLPGSSPAKDLAMFKKLYSSPDYMPDMIKIYPCVVNEHADLYKLWKKGKYKSYTDKQLAGLIIKIKKITPPFVRITRLIRDIPEESITSGNKITNLRQLISNNSKKDGWSCQCIRCREAGHADKDGKFQVESKKLKVKIREYEANNGKEYFISFESKDEKILYAFLRLRVNNSDNNFIQELKGASLVRELHTYGQLVSLGKEGDVQHMGFGKKLLLEAEKITKKHKLKKIAVISGIGVRKYYENNGYKLEGNYMTRTLI